MLSLLRHTYVFFLTSQLHEPGRPPKLLAYPAVNSMTRLARIQELTASDNKLKVATTFESAPG